MNRPIDWEAPTVPKAPSEEETTTGGSFSTSCCVSCFVTAEPWLLLIALGEWNPKLT